MNHAIKSKLRASQSCTSQQVNYYKRNSWDYQRHSANTFDQNWHMKEIITIIEKMYEK